MRLVAADPWRMPTLPGRCPSALALGDAQVPEYAQLHRTMKKALDLDLEKLRARAFDRAEWAEGVLRRYHDASLTSNGVVAQQLRALYNWMLVHHAMAV